MAGGSSVRHVVNITSRICVGKDHYESARWSHLPLNPVYQCVVDFTAADTPLGAAVIRAAANGHRGVLGYLLALGAPAPTEALANALLGGEWACVEALLVAGADLADSRRMAESLADSWPATARSRRAQIAFHVRRWEHSVAQRQAFLAL